MTNNSRDNDTSGGSNGEFLESLLTCPASDYIFATSATGTQTNNLQEAAVQDSPLLKCPDAPHLSLIDLPQPESDVDAAEANITVRSGEGDHFVDVLLLRNDDL
jgi:hypothetical protein